MSSKLSLRADMYVKNIREIPLDQLYGQGIRGLLFDLDNTIAAWRATEVNDQVIAWFQELTARGLKVGIVSNGQRKRVQLIGELLGIVWIARAGKPRRSAFLNACRMLELTPEQTAMVGDQMFTDLYGANRAGLYTILTEIVHPHEFWGTRYIMRIAERVARQLIKKNSR